MKFSKRKSAIVGKSIHWSLTIKNYSIRPNWLKPHSFEKWKDQLNLFVEVSQLRMVEFPNWLNSNLLSTYIWEMIWWSIKSTLWSFTIKNGWLPQLTLASTAKFEDLKCTPKPLPPFLQRPLINFHYIIMKVNWTNTQIHSFDNYN